ncbi:MAG: type VI-B CRISPR-associated RNA-guided ribonuclease Cas13b [Planctomycetota bacterium]|jgi:hypothetical protein|nr:type VI-B CRISPR-associated RNA-guided ribonuclease Cas13b [Planctomycetota bacterium]
MNSEQKAFWAMHCGMAVNNLLTVTQFLERKFAGDLPAFADDLPAPQKDDADDAGFTDADFTDAGFDRFDRSPWLAALRDKKGDIALQGRIVDALLRHLPFLREIKKFRESGYTNRKTHARHPATPLTPPAIAALFGFYAQLLCELRDEYTHAVHPKTRFDFHHPGFFDLERLVEASRRTVKERFYSAAKNDRQADCEAERQLSSLTPKIARNREVIDNPQYLGGAGFFTKDRAGFSPFGLAFFVTRFLEPKYLRQLLQELTAPRKIDPQLFIRAFGVDGIVLPRVRETPPSLGLEMLAELHKCPEELYPLLSPADQNSFRFNDGEDFFKRYDEDRFAYLALNYLDRQKKFAGLRFAVNLGRFFYADYGKRRMIDGQPIAHRRLSKPVYCFKRIQDTPARRLALPTGEYRQTPPQYVVAMNNLAVKLQDADEPDFVERGENGRLRFHNPAPDAYLSLYELPVVTFLAAQGKAEKVERRIADYCRKWHALRADLAAGKKIAEKEAASVYQLDFADLPDEVRAFIKTGKPSLNPNVAAGMKTKIAEMIADAERQLKSFRAEQEFIYKRGGYKPGKKSKRPRFTAASTAAFIARDAVRLQKPDDTASAHRGKITSANFQALQRSLAFFDYRKDSLPAIFAGAGLTRNPEFIEQLFQGGAPTWEIFFERYLAGKIKFLRGLRPAECYVLRRRVCRQKRKADAGYLEKWAASAAPVNLPRGLFTGLVAELLREKFPARKLPPRKNPQIPHNAHFLIKQFHEWSGDGYQWFYAAPRDANRGDWGRLTKFFTVKFKTGKDPKTGRKIATEKNLNPVGVATAAQQKLAQQWQKSPALATLYRLKKEYPALTTDGEKRQEFLRLVAAVDDREKRLRHVCLQDLALFYAAREFTPDVKLRDIEKGKFLPSEAEIVYSRPAEWPGEVTLTGKLTPKNYGDFRRLLNDPRLPSFLRRRGGADYAVVEKEFAAYDAGRQRIFAVARELEELTIDKYRLPAPATGKGLIDFEQIVAALRRENAIAPETAALLRVYRHAFARRVYPEYYPPQDDRAAAAAEREGAGDADLTKRLLARAEQCFREVIAEINR